MRKKKYFIGGVVNQGIQGVTQDMPDNSGKIIGGAAQFGIGAATGNPQDMIGGGIGMLSGGFNNAKEMFNNKDANFMDKALAAYGVINPIAGVASSFRNKALTERQQQDDVMNNIIKQNNMMANGGNLPPSEFQQYRNPYGNLQPLQNTLPYTPHPLDLEAIPPQRYNPFTPMEGITQPISNEPIDIENQWAKLPRNILDPTNKIYEMFSTNNYSGVPTSVNNNTGRQYSLSDLSGARNEQKRNQDILNYLTQSKQTAQEIQNHKQQHPEYFVDPGTYAGNLQSYLTSEAGQNKLSEALGDFDNINLGQRTTNPTYHAEGGMLNRFDGGFTHNDPSAQNSFEGIPIARGDNGETHVVENGEASLPTPDGNQYIFSDQNKLTKNLAKQLNIANKYVGKTFAQIAKSYEDNTRKGDPLDEKTFDLNTRNLMAANEQAKQISEIGKVYKMAKGGKLNINKYDGGSWLKFLNKYKTQAFYPENGIPYRYNDELGTTLTMDNTSNINNVNNNKQVITDNALPYNADFFDPSSPSLPYNTPSHTRRGYYGNNLQDQNAWIKTQLTPENINNWINPESPLNKDVDWRQNLIKEIQTKQPKLYNALLNGEVPEDKLIELYVESENGPIQSLVTSPYEHMVRRDVKLKNPDPILEIPKKSTTTKDEEETPTKNPPNLPNLWPELGLAGNLGAMAMLDPTYMTPSTMSTGYQDYNPLDVNKSDIAGNVSNMIAGMGASGNPYNILASGLQGMKGLDSAQQQANIYNLQDRSNVDARNIGVQDVVGARNLQYLNQANAMNTGIANQYDMEKADTFASAVGDYSMAGADRRMSNDASKFWGRATGYDPRTALYLLAMQNNNKPVEETKASAYGGVIKTRKRKLK